MTEHLPECDLAKLCPHNPAHDLIKENPFAEPFCYHCDAQCECLRLRACEQRVLADAPVSVFAKAFYDGQAVGFDKGVRAARDAVDGLPHWDEDSGETLFRACDKDDALAAIDALKEKP